MQTTPKIACRNLWKVFGAKPADFMARHKNNPQPSDFKAEGYIGAMRNISFEVYPGEILIIMGLSGSGKSTLIRALTRLNDPTSGEILMDGADLMKANAQELIELRRHKMGMVFQNFGLLPHRTVLSNVAFPLEVRGAPREEREKRAREMIKLVGLEGREGYFPRELSGGQQQRVGIARSLAVGPDIWFLDEPFSALDPLIRREMQDEFLRLQKMLKKTIVFITHDFDEAVRLGDRIGIMKDGELVQLAPPAEMVANPANEYVREFTRNAPRDHIISVGSIAQNSILPESSKSVSGRAKLAEVAPIVLRS
jgi:glycine betaine/proline transport system ATP-binding protein